MYVMGETENKRHLRIQNMQLLTALKRAALIDFNVIKYWKNLRTQQSIFLVLDFIVHLSHCMFWSRLAAIFMWFASTKNIQGSHYIFNGSVE
jgi:hypothetical protein